MKLKIIFILFMLNFNFVSAEISLAQQSEIYKNLRCLICQGQSVADSNSEFSQTIKLVVIDQIKKGKSEKEIYNFLAEKYGDWILYKPIFNKFNFLLWVLPYMVFFLGGLLIFFIIKKNKHN